MHNCEYCDREIKSGSTIEGVKCTCNIEPSTCEMPRLVVCSTDICQKKFQLDWYVRQIADLKKQEKEGIEKLKELNNTFRIIGIGPKGLETLIKEHGVNAPGMMIPQNPDFTWEKMSPDNLINFGQRFVTNLEARLKEWTEFLNEKAIKVKINKSLLDATNARIAEANKNREGKPDSNKTNGATAKPKVKLTDKEKTMVHYMKKFNFTQEQAFETVTAMGVQGEARDLKALGAI